MEKTELEKRWEAEVEEAQEAAAEEICCESCTTEEACSGSCKSCTDCSGEDKEDFDCILSPLSDDEIPLVLITDNNRVFLGGLLDFVNNGVMLDLPMVYVEMPDQQNPGRLQVGLHKVFHAMPVPNSMWFRHDGLNVLRLCEESLKLAAMYENTYKNIRMAESGLAMPSAQDVVNISRNG